MANQKTLAKCVSRDSLNMLERYLYPSLNILILAASFIFGSWLGKNKRWANPVCLICLVFIASFPFLNHSPAVISWVSRFKPSVFFFNTWVGWFAVMFLSAAAFYLPQKVNRRAIDVFTAVVASYFVLSSALFFLPSFSKSIPAVFDSNGVYLQTTDYTCAAASLVNLLTFYNVSATEQEMADLSFTVKNRGASQGGIFWALKEKLKSIALTPIIQDISFEQLKQLEPPVLITSKYSFFLDHTMVVLGYNPQKGQFAMADPSFGLSYWPEQKLKEKWQGLAIYLVNQK